jgi:excisionase family DNA binding protein
VTDRPWTAEEAADYLQHSEETIRRWARAGRIPGATKDPAGEWRFPPEDVKALLRPAKVGMLDQETIRRRLDAAYARARRA